MSFQKMEKALQPFGATNYNRGGDKLIAWPHYFDVNESVDSIPEAIIDGVAPPVRMSELSQERMQSDQLKARGEVD